MAESSPVLRLLVADEEPSEKLYQVVSTQIIGNPLLLSSLTGTDESSALLFGITTHKNRLSHLFDRIFNPSKNLSKEKAHVQALTTAAIIFFKHVRVTLKAVDDTQFLKLLLPMLQTCVGSDVPGIRNLFWIIIQRESVAEHLLTESAGTAAVFAWACSANQKSRDPATLEAWTEKVISMVKLCPGEHDLSDTINRWGILNDLKAHLKATEQQITIALMTSQNNQEPPNLARMGQLNEQKRQLLVAQHFDLQAKYLQFPEEVVLTMTTLHLEIPKSLRKLRETINTLEDGETLPLLQAALRELPCTACGLRLRTVGVESQSNGNAKTFPQLVPLPSFNMDVFGKVVGSWEVLLSSPALSALQSLQYTSEIDSRTIKQKLKYLAFGNWPHVHSDIPKRVRPKLPVTLRSTKCELSTKKGNGSYILWQVDLDVAYRSKSQSQVIKVWAIVDRGEISKVVQHVRLLQSTWSANKIYRCCLQAPTASTKTPRTPVVFEEDTTEVQSDTRKQVALDVRSMDQDLHSLVDKYYPLTEYVLRPRDLTTMSLEFPYKLSKTELNIVLHWDSPSLMLGRSGTGKTTCLIFKLVGKYINSKLLPGSTPPRQILLTKSEHLGEKIKSYIKSLVRSLLLGSTCGAFGSTNEEMQELEMENATILDLKDRHFPYVCTFESFLEMLENTCLAIRPPKDRTLKQPHKGAGTKKASSRKGVSAPKHYVDFATFEHKYWPRLSQHLQEKLPVASAFAEIMGVIKGSRSLGIASGPMTLEEYLDKSDRVAPTFTLESERVQTYQLFQRYERLKQDLGGIDNVDRVTDVLVAMQKDRALKQILSSVFDEFYIDEVQDQRIADLQLFLGLLKESRGFHAAGDTAQNISKDSTFRFADIQALVHDHFQQTDQKLHANPTTFRLGFNYRSHDGIVKLASFIVDLLWRAFPQTIDKMVPELGQLRGPLPIIFVGCEPEVLKKVKLDSSNQSSSTASFGAEQAIILRDDRSREDLIEKIGEIGLYLTLGESKGMEFGDVVLYNFFSSCADLNGFRHLPFLLSDSPQRFDPHQHAALCSELKQLYVGCTRARSILFFVETMSEKELSSISALFTSHTFAPLIKVVRPDDPAFDSYLEPLFRNARKTTKAGWIQKGNEFLVLDQYDRARHCFEQAVYDYGIDLVDAKKNFKKGSILLARDDATGAISAFEAAASIFLRVNRTSDAVNSMCMIGRFAEAAEMWVEKKTYDKAATLFASANMYHRAFDCHCLLEDPEAAADALWRGRDYDTLVNYLDQHRDFVPEATIRSYGAKCIFPLKQNRISPEHRKEAVSLLGSFKEQERLFRQFDMYEAIEELYLSAGRVKDIFDLRLHDGKLEQALGLMLLQLDMEQFASVPKEKLDLLIDFVVLGRLIENARRKEEVQLSMLYDLQKLAEYGYGSRIQEWELALEILKNGIQAPTSRSRNIEDQRIKFVAALQVLDPKPLEALLNIDSLLSDTLQEAFSIVKDVLIKKEEAEIMPHLLLVCGVWETESSQNPYIILPWSPLSATDDTSKDEKLSVPARAWTEERLTNAVITLDEKFKALSGAAWPARCIRFTTTGRCEKPGCDWLHEKVTRDTYATATQKLLRLNNIFCTISALYRKVLDEKFNTKILGIRRHWLERLIKEITWVSAFEQDNDSRMSAMTTIVRHNSFASVATKLEALLYYRLEKQWGEMREYSSLLEQVQLATMLGANRGFFRNLSHILWSEPQGRIISGHLSIIQKLENDVIELNPRKFLNNLEDFRTRLAQLQIEAFASFHSLTSVFEYLTTHMIFRVSRSDFIVPRSWIILHVSRLYEAGSPLKAFEYSDGKIYQHCLFKLTNIFCDILKWLDSQLEWDSKFRVGNFNYRIPLLQQRNAELLAVARLNLGLSDADSKLTSQTTTTVNQVLALSTIRKQNLAYTVSNQTAGDALVKSAARYEGKNPLVVFKKVSGQSYAVGYLRATLNLGVLTLDQLQGELSLVVQSQPRNQQQSAEKTEPEDRFTSQQVDYIQNFQRLWRRHLVHVVRQGALLKRSTKHQQIARFQQLTAACPTVLRVRMRFLFVTRGLQVLFGLNETQARFWALNKAVKIAVDTAEESAYDKVGEVVKRCDDTREALDMAGECLSDERLKKVVDGGDLEEIGSYLEWAQACLDKVNGEIMEMEMTV